MSRTGDNSAILQAPQGRHGTKPGRRGGRQGPGPYLTHAEAAEFLCVSRWTLSRWHKDPEFMALIRPSRIGPGKKPKWRYRRDRLEAYMELTSELPRPGIEAHASRSGRRGKGERRRAKAGNGDHSDLLVQGMG